MRIVITLPDGAPTTEHSESFILGMLQRMLMSYYKYGRVADAYPDKVDALASLKQRIVKYHETGNTEYLMDVANFAMIEFMHPRQPNAHYKAEDSGASPGRVWASGEVHAGSNNNREGRAIYKRDGD